MYNMDENPGVLDFVKAVSDADRLRIIGVLARAPATTAEVASHLNLPFREVFSHLGQLEFAGVVHKTGEVFSLDDEALAGLSRQQFFGIRGAYLPAPELDAITRKVLVAYLNADGSLKQIPTQPAKLHVILIYLAAAFEPALDYTEKEVNTLLHRFHPDTAALRRALVDAGLLSRESNGSRYWKTRQE
jgi:hypothetical protein